ncbi:MAG: hypothetical protein KC613_15685 [Myxococcales bacterium]|nr:hypothetical protein [Myxococcales bacterium]
MAAAWAHLQTHRDRWEPDARAYLSAVRGWTDDLVSAALDTGWIAYACSLPRGAGGALVREARNHNRLALFALYGPAGVPRSAERRWHRSDACPGRKALSLSNDQVGNPADWGGVRAFGRIPQAVAAAKAGEPVYLCEGGPDTLAAAAWCRLQGRGAALGAPSDNELRKVAAALADALDADGVSARVVLVPHLDPAGQAGGDAAADALRGRLAVDRVELPAGGDLADAAAGLTGPRQADPALSSADALSAVLGAAKALYRPPLPVTGDAYRARMAEIAADAVAQAQGSNLVVVSAPVGAGKSHAFMRAALNAASEGRTVVWAVETHTLGDEHERRLGEVQAELERAGGVAVRTARGALYHCRVLPTLDGRPAENLRRTYLAGGRGALCAGCLHAADCEGSEKPRAMPGAVTVVAHAALPTLDLDAGALVVVDELPDFLRADPASPLGSLRGDREWSKRHPFGAEAVATLSGELDSLAAGHGEKYARTLGPNGLADFLAKLNADPTLQAARDELAAGEPAGPPKLPFGEQARAGGGHGYADRSAWDALQACLALAAGEPTPPGEAWGLRLQPYGAGWTLERRRVLKLPENVPVVALDATAGRSRVEWQAWAQATARDLVEIDSPGTGQAPAFAVHYATQQLDSKRLYLRGENGTRMTDEAPGAVRSVFEALENALRGAKIDPADGLGILTGKALADALRLGIGAQLDSPAPACDPDCPNVQAVSAFAAALQARGWKLKIGHRGRHHRGWDELKGWPVAVLGPMRPELAAVEADAAALNAWGVQVDAAELMGARAHAATVQALGRARHLQEGAGLFVAAKEAPPAGGDLPGVVWRTVEPTTAPAMSLERRDLVDVLRRAAQAHLGAHGWISPRWLEAEWGAPRRAAKAVAGELAARFDLVRVARLNGAAWASGDAGADAARAWSASASSRKKALQNEGLHALRQSRAPAFSNPKCVQPTGIAADLLSALAVGLAVGWGDGPGCAAPVQRGPGTGRPATGSADGMTIPSLGACRPAGPDLVLNERLHERPPPGWADDCDDDPRAAVVGGGW